jgi:hypothetical protein
MAVMLGIIGLSVLQLNFSKLQQLQQITSGFY